MRVSKAVAFGLLVLGLEGCPPELAPARDLDGRYAQADGGLHDWIMSLHAKGSGYWCCDLADGETTQQDIRRGADGGTHFFVYVDEAWREVPDEALVDGPNLLGRPIVWVQRHSGTVHVTCFLAGALG